jgi:sugar phosphate isomerase/epimerase
MNVKTTSSHSRREFLVSSTAAVTAAALQATAPELLRAADAPVGPSIQLFMMSAELQHDMPGTLAKLAAIGYKDVEGFFFANHAVKEFRNAVENAGLACTCAHFAFGFEAADKLLDDAGSLGVQFAVSSMLPPRAPIGASPEAIFALMNNLSRDDFKLMAQLANQIGEKANKRGLHYAYHNHNIEFRDFGNGETGYTILLKETDPNLVKFEIDLGWAATGGANPLQLLRTYPDRLRLLHFKDFSVLQPPVTVLGTGREQQIVELGHGLVPFKPIVAEAKKQHIQHFIVDQDPPFHGKTAFDAAKIDFDYLQGLLAAK